MENEKVQEVAPREILETPEEVQQEAGLSIKKVEENSEGKKKSDEESVSESGHLESDEGSPLGQVEREDAEEHIEGEEDLNFDGASKTDLLGKIKEVSKDADVRQIDKVIRALKARFDEIYNEEKGSALNKFEEEGNDPESFDYHGDDIGKEFLIFYSNFRSKRNKYYQDFENQKEDNLKKKQGLLEELRMLVDGEESNASIHGVKEIQAEWRQAGPVSGTHNKTLWANYNALLDRFYDQRSIYFELKDLDRKKNLKFKEELCEKAEAMVKLEDLRILISQLNELHQEYKHAGPVPKEDQERVWARFKVASDAVYLRRRDFFDQLKVELEENYTKKQKLAIQAEDYVNFDSDRLADWDSKAREIQELQKQWERIGGLPKDRVKATNKQFWGSFKIFFNHKSQFFKKLGSIREENLKKKEELTLQVEALKESEDWDTVAQRIKSLQAEWKTIGPIPEKVRNGIYKKFKVACDHFFDRKRNQSAEQNTAYKDNLTLKLQICDQIESIADQDDINLDDVYDLIDSHARLGFVPRNAIKKSQARFEEATHKILSLEELRERDKMDLESHIQLRRIKNSHGGDKILQRKRSSIRRQISELENDISTWNTNMEFFATSAVADELKADLHLKINVAKGELEYLKAKLSSVS